ncbi:hypothetical protein [Pedobacter miscanthi]|nr:hypothetical protein [Pedobacter miscanthi]
MKKLMQSLFVLPCFAIGVMWQERTEQGSSMPKNIIGAPPD